MTVRKSLAFGLCAAILLSTPALAGEKKEGGERKGNEIKAAVPANYIQIPLIRLMVPEDASAQYRSLELEVWLSAEGVEKVALLNSSKKKIKDGLKEDLGSYRWEAFGNPQNGVELAKMVVAQSVERSAGVKPDEVIVKTLLLR